MVSLKSILGRSPIAQAIAQWRSRTPKLSRWQGVVIVGVVGLAVSTSLTGVSQWGWLEGLERLAYDQMVRLRHRIYEPPLDDRILVITVTEGDLEVLEEFPLSDQSVARALAALQAYEPAAIGLDIYRDVPRQPGREALVAQLQAENVVVITKLPDIRTPGIPAPQEASPAQVSFNDVVVDADGGIRRSLLMGEKTTPEGPQILFSLSLKLSLRYLATQGITPQASTENPTFMQLGATTFKPLQSGSGGYATTDAGGYQVMLDYRNRITPARQVTLMQVLNQEIDPDWVRGKIVLIGIVAPSVKDLFYTPFTGAGVAETHQMPGVVIHAQMVSQILDAATGTRSLFWLSTPWEEWLWCLGWALLAGSITWRLRHPISLALSQGGLVVVVIGVGFGIFLHRGWIPVIAPVATVMGTGVLVLAYQAQQSARQRQMMLTLLGQTASPEIANALWENRDRLIKSGKLPGQKAIATMLFTDIRGFSTLAEVTSPEQLLDWLNDYLSAMTEEIQAHHGIVNKFTGDGLLAVFGVPIVSTTPGKIAQDAQHAVDCAITMDARLAELNQYRQRQGLPLLQMRVGIFTGPVVVGSLGGQHRMEYGIIGDSVNIASRLESFDKERQPTPCRILIGQETLNYLQGKFQVESWGDLILKGRHHPVGVYRVLGRTSTPEQSLPSACEMKY